MTAPAPHIASLAAAAAAPSSRGGRILGIDAARAVALVGMMATHILPLSTRDGRETLTGLLADGRASALFAVLAGVGVALSTGGTRRPPDVRAHLAAASGLVVRGVLVALVGLLLVGLSPPVAVILAYYGLLFVLATPLLRLPAGALAAGAVLVCAVAPVLSHVLRAGLPDGPGPQAGLAALTEPGDLLITLALTGYYPAVPWLTYLLAGMAVGRLDLRRVRTAVTLLVGGTVVSVVASGTSALLLGAGGGSAVLTEAARAERHYGSTPTDTWWWLAIDAPHSGTPLDLAHTTGTALAVIGAMLLLARFARPVAWLPAAIGAAPLTLYTAHVVAVTVSRGNHEVSLWLTHVAVAAAVGAALALAGWRGPLELAVSAAARATWRAVGGRPAPAGDDVTR